MNPYNDNLLHINARELTLIMKERTPTIIDIREPYELEESSIPEAVNIPMNALLNNMDSILKKDQMYYILCHTGQRSYYVTDVLTKFGYLATNVFGGIAQLPEYYHDKS